MPPFRAPFAFLCVALAACLGTPARAEPLDHNPVTFKCASMQKALLAAKAFAKATRGSLILTSGTASMEPLIHGQVYVVLEKIPYEAITYKDILAYDGRLNADSPLQQTLLHRTVGRDRFGWLMSGDSNRWSESWDRVTPANYLGRAVALFEFPQA
ncbi:MAG TPA: hypothetical protein VII09_07270 [Opitutaceae bacterium]